MALFSAKVNTVRTNVRGKSLRNGPVDDINPPESALIVPAHFKVFTNTRFTAATAESTMAQKVITRFLMLSEVYPDVSKRAAAAIVIEVCHEASISAWQLTELDFAGCDRVESDQSAAWTAARTATALAGNTPDAGWGGFITADLNAAGLAVTTAAAHEDFISKLYKMAPGVFITYGAALVASGGVANSAAHVKFHTAVIGQVWDKEWESKTYGTLSAAEFKDLVCNWAFAGLPPKVMIALSRDPITKVKLHNFGLAAAVVRVPSQHDSQTRLGAVMKLLHQTSSIMKNHNINVGDISERLKEISDTLTTDLAAAETTTATLAAAEKSLEALKIYESDFAYVYGFREAAMNVLTTRFDSLGDSSYLKRISSGEVLHANTGATDFAAGAKWAKGVARGGVLVGVGRFGATAPPSRGSKRDRTEAGLEDRA